MNREKIAGVEARLHRSLQNQVRVPQLDRRFDAGVWARIEAEQQAQSPATRAVPARSSAEKWLMVSNVVGIAVAVALVLFFGLRMFSGVDMEVSMPVFSGETVGILIWSVTGAAFVFGAMFTPVGRWLRAEFT